MSPKQPTSSLAGKRCAGFLLKQFGIAPVCLSLIGCMTAAQHQQQLGNTQDRALTLGIVQKQIKAGMSQADVAAALGSPNIVTGDSSDREVWIYDKVATETSYSNDGGSVASSLSGTGTFPGVAASDASGSISGSVNQGYSKSAGAVSLTQRTLTVIVKFTAGKAVESVSYNSTRF